MHNFKFTDLFFRYIDLTFIQICEITYIYIFSSYLAFNPKSNLKILALWTVFYFLSRCESKKSFDAFGPGDGFTKFYTSSKSGKAGTKLPPWTRFEILETKACTAYNFPMEIVKTDNMLIF